MLIESAQSSIRSLTRHKLRSALTILGILIGVASVVIVTTLSSAASEKIGGQIDSFGTNTLFVGAKQSQSGGRRFGVLVTEKDADAIALQATSVAAVTPVMQSQIQVIAAEKNVLTTVIGARLPYFGIRKFEIARGDKWSPSDELLKARVCILGSKTADALFGDRDPVGSWVRIKAFPFRVIGVMREKGAATFSDDEDDRIIVPLGTYRSRLLPSPGRRVDMILVSATSSETVDRAKSQIISIVRAEHKIKADAPEDFSVSSQAEFRKMEEGIFGILTAILGTVAMISLFVGGVGVMNIMLVTVTERTREIGIRLAIGARAKDVRAQFLVESMMLSGFGGFLGLVFGLLVAALVGFVFDWSIAPKPLAILGAILASTIVGLVFGYVPARKASGLDPIDALRSE